MQGGGEPSIRVFLDAPLPRRASTLRRRYERLCRCALIAMLAAPAAAAPIGPAERPAAASAGGASATDAAAAELPADGAMLSGDISDLDSDGSDALSVDDDGDGDDEPLPAAAGPAPAATPAAGERMASAAEPFAPGEDSRYDLWDLGGGRRVVVRARVAGRGSAERCGGGAGRAGREVVVRSKMEYQEEAGLEETKVEEWAAWRAALHLRPDADLLVRAWNCDS